MVSFLYVFRLEEKLVVPQLVKEYSASCGTSRFITVKARHDPVPRYLNLVHTSYRVPLRSILILSSYLHRSLSYNSHTRFNLTFRRWSTHYNQRHIKLSGLTFIRITAKNKVSTSQKSHCVTATKTNRLMLFREITTVFLRSIRNTQIHSVGRMHSFFLIQKQVVRIVTIGSYRVKFENTGLFE
jgi:hypothetical protein